MYSVGCVQCGVCTMWGVYSVWCVQRGVCTMWGVYSVGCVQCRARGTSPAALVLAGPIFQAPTKFLTKTLKRILTETSRPGTILMVT